MQTTPIVSVQDIDIERLIREIPLAKSGRGHKKTQHGVRKVYLDIVCAFDIECSTIEVNNEPQAIMYIWQFQLGEQYTIIGRTWDGFVEMVKKINIVLEDRDARLMVYVHNLAYEFQFLCGVWDFAPEDSFCTDARSPLYCLMGRMELRCSYRLSNYSLAEWSRILHVDHPKLPEIDYSEIRYPWTELSDEVIAYSVTDVVCVVECVKAVMASYEDTLYSIPYTSTGYIRRRVKPLIKLWSWDAVSRMQNDLSTYLRLRQAFRGGDTHANIYHVGAILPDVYSYDRSSSYPDVIVHRRFPMSRFKAVEANPENVKWYIEQGYAVLMKVGFWNIRLQNPVYGLPYIPLDKCLERGFVAPIKPQMDNGRIREADYCEIAMTDLDFEIVSREYAWEGMTVHWLMVARYGDLPRPLVDLVIELYRNKTSMKGVAGQENVYRHSKELINSVYGMMCQRVMAQPIKLIGNQWVIQHWRPTDRELTPEEEASGLFAEETREEAYQKAIDKAFLNYAWAVWITAHARLELHKAVWIASQETGLNFVYADTDSVKVLEDIDLAGYNARKIKEAKRSGAYATDPKGNVHYMGVFEFEGRYDQFVTLGAKRYCTVEDGKLEITVAGVPKIAGAKELERKGGIAVFEDGFIFSESGKTGALYNDDVDMWIEIDGHSLHITRNVVIMETTFNMSLTPDYRQMHEFLTERLDTLSQDDYNKKW